MIKVVLGSVILFATACSGVDSSTSSTTQAATGSNGLFQNGLTTNGVYQNGVYQNGVYQNGVYQNGVYQNGVYQNGVYQNGVYQNGVYQNGVYQNGVYQNGVYQNGVYQNGVYQNGVYQNGGAWITGLWSNSTWQVGTNAEALRTNKYTRQFLQYVYGCAMPGTGDAYATVLDPWNGTLACKADHTCDEGFTCSSFNTCVVPLQGAIGVGVNADGTTWAQRGTCDESCQRWVSSCLLARTNAYGAHVNISMRAPDDAPQAVKDALAVSPAEAAVYNLREGAYYGNVFATTPDNGPPSDTYSGPTDGLVTATPRFYACAGPGSSIPEITKRFCSSQGDNQVINVTGVCSPMDTTGTIVDAQCEDPDAGGAVHNCIGDQTYKEVITVYIHDPIAICGNSVCESTETATSCPTDCHAGGWALSSRDHIDAQFENYLQASNVAATADGVVVATSSYQTDTWTVTSTDVVKYTPAGAYQWSQRVQGGLVSGIGLGIGVGPTGTIAIATFNTPPFDPFPDGTQMLVSTFASDGSPVGSWYLGTGTFTPQGPTLVDATGNVYIVGTFLDTMQIGSQSVTSSGDDVFVVKLAPDGTTAWLARVGDTTDDALAGSALDAQGNVLLAVTGTSGAGIYKLDGATGAVLWRKAGAYNAVATDPVGNVYAAGVIPAGHDFKSADTASDLFVAKYAPDGTFLAVQTSGRSCHVADCSTGAVHPYLMKVDGNNVIVAAIGGSSGLDPILGPTTFTTYQFPSLFVTAFATSDLHYAWTMEIPFILGGFTNGMDVDHAGHVYVAGTYNGSMIVDGALLINDNPLFTDHSNTFVSSFNEPPASDTTPPQIGNAFDQTGAALHTVPSDIVAQATSSAGATVFFMPPTAIDNGGAAVTVSCSPAPNTTFPIDITPVTCTAANANGYASSAQFTVTVRDSLAPFMMNVPADLTSPTAVVTFALPTAIDQVDGNRPVTCSPATGSTFHFGLTTVSCSASDTAGNTVQGSFSVTVTASDTTPPRLTVPGALTAEATGPTGASVAYAATASDDTDGAITPSCAPPSGATFSIGATTVTCSAHDAAGNSSTASFVVTIRDTTAPAVSLPANLTASATSASGAAVSFTSSASDIVDGSLPTTCTPASGSVFAIGTTTVTCSAHDTHANAASKTFTVTVSDTTAPVITVPANITVAATNASGAPVTFASSATDVVDGSVPVTCTPASGSVFAIGTTTVTCSAHDAHANAASKSFTVTVGDTTAPVITVPANITVPATSGSGASVTYTTSATDAIDGTVATSCTPPSGATFAIGTTTVTCSAHDTHGNTATKSFTVTVTNTDTTAPTITVPANLNVVATTATGAPVTFAVSATDAVDGNVAVTCSKTSGSAFVLGTTTVTCTAHDSHNNTASRSFTVTVQMSWGGVLLPINADGSSEFKLGTIVPVRFSLTGASANLTNAVATVTFTKTSSTITGTHHKLPRYFLPTSGTTAKYNPLTHHYYFRNDTTGLTAGTYTVKVDFHDGAVHTAQISLGSFTCGSCENDGGDD